MSAVGDARRMPLKTVLIRWDAIVLRWELDPFERSMIVGGFPPGPIDGIETYRLLCGEERMRLVVELDPALMRRLGDDGKVRFWLRCPNVNLEGRRPIDVMGESPEWMRWLISHTGDVA